MASPVQKLMAKEIDRKQFLLHAGAVVLALTGVSGLVKTLTEPATRSSAGGYGSSTYGGRKEDRP
jgi:hypothetical protein